MQLPHTVAGASASLVALCLVITAGLAVAVPAARLFAGRRCDEAPAQRRAATLRAAIGVAAWLALTGGLAAVGALADFSRFPPPLMPLMAGGLVLVTVLALSSFGRRLAEGLPLALIVGAQGFRIAVELMLHRAWVEGLIGRQMTWSGLNFDVLSGLSGLALGLWLWRRGDDAVPRILLWVWNLLGLALLLTIVSIAIMSMPGPLRLFAGPANVWVGSWPFVWLPTMMVAAALFGHLLLARRLLQRGAGEA